MSSQPNIIVLVSHDTGRHLSPYGVETVRTPNVERLAREGVLFTNTFCGSPGCCPARAALFSGRPAHQTGILGQTGAWAGFRFSPEVAHAAKHLAGLGYETIMLGFAHEIAGAGCPDTYFDGVGFDRVIHKRGLRASQLAVEVPQALADHDVTKPFYLQIGIQETHRRYLADGVQPFRELGVFIPESPALSDGPGTEEEFAELQGSVNRLDEGLGALLDFLEETGLAANTLLVFTTDHGLPMPREKTTLYDRGIGVYLLMRYPGVFPAGQRVDDLVSHTDVLPTLLEMAGGRPPAGMEGRSLLPCLTRGEPHSREHVFAEKTFHTSYDPVRCVRSRRYKYIFNFESVYPETACLDIYNRPVLLESLPFLSKAVDRWDELYDLEADPGETKNLATDPGQAERRKEMASALFRWMSETGDPLLKGPVASPRFSDRLQWLGAHAS